jgi:hypothetical protein
MKGSNFDIACYDFTVTFIVMLWHHRCSAMSWVALVLSVFISNTNDDVIIILVGTSIIALMHFGQLNICR